MFRVATDYKTVLIGQEKEPIVIIDNFSGQVDQLRATAQQAQYSPAGAGYPGVRAPANPGYLSQQGQLLAEAMFKVFGFSRGATCESCMYSIVTTAPHTLVPAQRIPHYDSTDPNLLAAMHYLSGAEMGGTAFYRHRRTGFEAISTDRINAYRKGLHKDDQEYGEPDPGYIYGDTQRYEMIADIPAKTDRLILYRGRTLHSGSIANPQKLTTSPAKGRLTINTFLVNLK